MGYSFLLTARVLLYAPPHRQDSTYHGLCYTSRGDAIFFSSYWIADGCCQLWDSGGDVLSLWMCDMSSKTFLYPHTRAVAIVHKARALNVFTYFPQKDSIFCIHYCYVLHRININTKNFYFTVVKFLLAFSVCVCVCVCVSV